MVKNAQESVADSRFLEKDFLSFLKGFFVILFALMSLFLLYFESPLPNLAIGAFGVSIPAIIVLVLLQTIALAIPRRFCSRFASRKALMAIRIVAFLGLCLAPFTLLNESLGLLFLPIEAIGITAASLLWCLCLCKYKHLLLASLIAIAFAFAACIVGSISALSLPKEWVVLLQCICGALSLFLLAPKYDGRLFDMLSVSAEESRKRALTVKVDRWTYSLIGIDFGFAIGIALLANNPDFAGLQPLSSNSEHGVSLFFAAAIALTGILLFAMRPHFDYTLEKVTKHYLTLSVSACILIMTVSDSTIQCICLILLLIVTFMQMAIIVSAGIEFIDFDELSPVWYLAEEAFVSGGIAFGLLMGGWVANFEINGSSLFPICCILITLINIFMQPTIDKGYYPASKALDDVLRGNADGNSLLAPRSLEEAGEIATSGIEEKSGETPPRAYYRKYLERENRLYCRAV